MTTLHRVVHHVRVERLVPLEPRHYYPVCLGGRRAVPPEGCGGPWAFLALRQHYSVVAVTRRLAELLGDVLVPAQPRCPRCQRASSDEHREELTVLRHWARADRFDRVRPTGDCATSGPLGRRPPQG
jgi:hypothetical protein